MFTKQTVVSFEGLNSNVAPELINDGEARDIYNFRMEKIGKLVNRNGYSIGLYADTGSIMLQPQNIVATNLTHVASSATETDKRRMAYIESQGIISMGEYILETKWNAADTDRMMLYYIRTNVTNLSYTPGATFAGATYSTYRNEHNVKRDQGHLALILMSPMNGKFKNKILMGIVNRDGLTNDGAIDWTLVAEHYASQDISDKRTETPMSEVMNTQLYAPNKVGNLNDEWINQYATMRQYRNRMVISDPINGDMFIEDLFSYDYDPDSAKKKNGTLTYVKNTHEFVLRPNALESFDINIVDIGLREREGEENDNVYGVESGMALYRYVLPKKRQIVSTDYFENKLPNNEWLGLSETFDQENPTTDAQRRTALYSAYQRAYSVFNSSKVKMRYLGGSGLVEAVTDADDSNLNMETRRNTDYILNLHMFDINESQCIYTNASENEEFYDVFGNLEFAKEEYDDEEGKKVTEIPADVYIWNDLKLTYYASSGIIKGSKYLTDNDKTFTKKSSDAPRITELNDIPDSAKHVPLGGWKYRFVWDFGDGIYSAPSSDLWVPDKLWSAVKDEWLDEYYIRPHDLFSGSPMTMLDHASDKYIKSEKYYRYPSLFEVNKQGAVKGLTKIGELVKRIKDTIYEDVLNKYGNVSLNINDELSRGNFATFVTATFGDSDVVTNGVIYEGMHLSIIDKNYKAIDIPKILYDGTTTESKDNNFRVHKMDDLYYKNYYNEVDKHYNNGLSYLAVPIFKNTSLAYTRNSLFDDEGRFRLLWLNEDKMGGSKPFAYQLVFPGVHPNIPSQNMFYDDDDHRVKTSDFLTKHFVNTIHHQRSTYYDTSNIYLNFICQDEVSVHKQDRHNEGASEYMYGVVLVPYRPRSAFRAVINDRDRLINVSNTDVEALNRLIIADALAELKVMDNKDRFSLVSEALLWDNDYGYVQHPKDVCSDNKTIDTLDYDSKRYPKGARRFVGNMSGVWPNAKVDMAFIYPNSKNIISKSLHYQYIGETALGGSPNKMDDLIPTLPNYFTMGDMLMIEDDSTTGTRLRKEYSGINVHVYGQAERLIAVEQLCSYFPSSLLFNAPRFSIEIPNDKIPKRAKKLLIFRTKSTLANDYDPHSYGLVEEFEINRLTKRRADGMGGDYKKGDVISQMGKQNDDEDKFYDGIYFFDDVQDVSLDFSNDIYQYEGLRKPLWSRFNIAINENVYYGNYYEGYNPLEVREYKEAFYYGHLKTIDIEQSFGLKGYAPGTIIDYKIQYVDFVGIKSKEINLTVTAKELPEDLEGTGSNIQIIFKFLPSTYDPSIEKVKIYRRLGTAGPDDYTLVGELDKKDVGIFVDKNKDMYEDFNLWYPNIVRYNSGVRWSERYRPDWIKYENMAEYASGDGKHITGLASLDGNLVVLKETSMYRVAVQAADPPLSRTDQISPEIGCIAPNTLINVDNNLYFLSSKGWIRYDNNVPSKIDGKFDEELQFYIHMLGDDIRDATSGYNPAYNEIYLNLPKLPENPEYINNRIKANDRLALAVNQLLSSGENVGTTNVYDIDLDNIYRIYEREDWFYEVKRRLMGNIYVLNLNTGAAYKFGYQPTLITQPNTPFTFLKRDLDNKNGVRMYYTNSQGEMRSAEIKPAVFGDKIRHAGIYIDTPYGDVPFMYRDEDQEVNGYYYFGKVKADYSNELFPMTYNFPVRSSYKSKLFTGDDETLIKRVRKTLLNLYSRGYIRIEVYTVNYDTADDRIKDDNNILRKYTDDITGRVRHVFSPTENRNKNQYAEMTNNGPVDGRYTNILQIIPQSQYDGDELEPLSKIFDLDGKPVKYGIEIYTEYRTQVNEIAFYWRPIHTYLS